jgi:hypothetical protein
MTRIEDPERVPDWLLGGRVRRRVLQALDGRRGARAVEIAAMINAGEATVFEVIRGLKRIGAVEPVARGSYRIAREDRIGCALHNLLVAAETKRDEPVSRPPGRVKRQ